MDIGQAYKRNEMEGLGIELIIEFTSRGVNHTVYGYGRTPYGEYTAFGRTVS